jgi:tetratricopeptide (TPR) repeat protein
MQAFVKSKTAKVESDYTNIIDLCRAGIEGGLTPKTEIYAGRLMAWALNRRGEMRARDGRDALALKDFDAAVGLDPTLWRAVHNRGVSYATLGKYKQAIADFDRTIQMKKNYPNAYFNRGELLYEMGEFPAAIENYNQAIRLAPGDSAALNSRGHAQYRMRHYREAIADYTESIRLQPDNAAAYTNRGDAYADLRQWGQAAEDYRAAIRRNAKLGRAYQSAAWLMATCPDRQFRNSRLAVPTAERAIELDGENDFRYLATLAAAQASAGNFDEAQKVQARVLKLAPKADLARNERRLKLYQQHIPFREAPAAPQQDDVRQARRNPGPANGVTARQ